MEYNTMNVSSGSSSNESIDFEGIPATDVGTKKTLKVCTYQELHVYVNELIKVLEEVYEMGIMKGTIQKFNNSQEDIQDQLS